VGVRYLGPELSVFAQFIYREDAPLLLLATRNVSEMLILICSRRELGTVQERLPLERTFRFSLVSSKFAGIGFARE
jgi:hypothetical protein